MAEGAPEAKGPAAQGASSEHLDDGQSVNGAPNAPELNNTPPEKEGLNEEHGNETPEEKAAREAAEKEAADKAAKEAAEAEEKAKEKQNEPELKEYVTLDDPAGQAAIDLLKEAGVSPADANAIFAEAIETGDITKIDRKALVEKIGEAKATLVIAGATDYYNRQKEANEAAVKAVHKAVGGKEAWESLRTWAQAQEKADNKFTKVLDPLRNMLDQGGVQAELAARELVRLYNADPNTKGLGNGNKLEHGNLNTGSGTPLTRADYVAELKKAHERGAKPAEIAALDARRKAGKAAGI